ncbi:MAG: DUF1822 family protein [Cyanobacteriota bacterium]|nr:DUF1822 family protein [Cyanobacteriota bacterium]
MNAIENPMFAVPLTSEAYRVAKRFKSQHKNPRKAHQVYLNTLAVYAVDFYCRCMEIETDIQASDTFDLNEQTLMDVADLQLTNLGKIECRPVLPDAEYFHIPAETWEDRIGYLVVEIDDDSREATLLGFYPRVNSLEMVGEKVSLDDILPLVSFLDCLKGLKDRTVGDIMEPISRMVNLSEWMENLEDGFKYEWQSLESFLQAGKKLVLQSATGMRFRGREEEKTVISFGGVKEFQLGEEAVVMAIAIEAVSEDTRNIRVQLYPSDADASFPSGLQLIVIDDDGEIFLKSQYQPSDKLLEAGPFSAKLGDSFKIEVLWGGGKIAEKFVV